MHETSMVRLPHLHPTQEDHGEGNTHTMRTRLNGSKIRGSSFVLLYRRACWCFSLWRPSWFWSGRPLTCEWPELWGPFSWWTADTVVPSAGTKGQFDLKPQWSVLILCLFWMTSGENKPTNSVTVFPPIRNLRQIFQSLPPFIDILLLLLFFMVIFAILGKKTPYLKVNQY